MVSLLFRLLTPLLLVTITRSFTPIIRTQRPCQPWTQPTRLFVSGGFSFDDGLQVLVSVQKPLGIVLEQDGINAPIFVAQLDPDGSAGNAGIQLGDMLVAVQNASTESADLDEVLAFLGQAPRVVNLRFIRLPSAER